MKLIDIKLVGYLVLLFGFAALSLPVYPDNGSFKALSIHQWQDMPQQETYSRDDLLAAMEKVAGSAWHRRDRPPIGGALVMLIGAILIDIGSRRKKVREQQPDKM
jgi:hypothetical protein